MTTLEVQPDKRICVIDGMPEEPKRSSAYNVQEREFHFKIAYRKYHEALTSAPRLLVSDQEQAKRLIKQKYGHDLDEMIIHTVGYIYPIPDLQWEVGSKCELWCSDCKAFDWSTCRERQVAILKESTPSTEQESQEELWKEAIKLYNKKEHSQDGRTLLMKQFTITRKL